ncbi:hypothetical protein BH10BAC3_BH10BAC3_33000 [soil metagenome]
MKINTGAHGFKHFAISTYIFTALLACLSFQSSFGQLAAYNLTQDKLATSWDEAIPLGNGMLGALVWEKDGKLRFSLDRADLWDSRPMKGLHRKEFSYQWVQQQVAKKDYKPVQEYFDKPYDQEPAPTKIPGGALECNIQNWGAVKSAELQIEQAIAEVHWENGTGLFTYVDANNPIGWFRFENIPANFQLDLVPPPYTGAASKGGDIVGGDDLTRLDYPTGDLVKSTNSITYLQKGWGNFNYLVTVVWKQLAGNIIEGVWTISSSTSASKKASADLPFLKTQLAKGYVQNYLRHVGWWKNYWAKSAINVPDSMLEKQWYLEQYKFGSASRKGAPPISLQAVWTADNGRIAPWKGDFHHDLNTQLSYWPAYAGNHLDEAMVYLDHLDSNKKNYKRYTKLYFGKDGLNVPGVTTLNGTEMGGWIQYSLSPTVGAWLSQHFYLQWRYSMDRQFLTKRAYPWIKEVAVFLEQVSSLDSNGHRKLPISASPEINDNDLSAWFHDNTNYDLALMKYNFTIAKELANELGLKEEAAHWDKILNQFGDFALSSNSELMFAPTLPYNQSHRHFSHMMAIHPLGLIKWEDGDASRTIIRNSLQLLDSIGPRNWCGYSYAWEANIKARAKDGEGAAKALTIFAKAFCSPNSFHLNGDQTKSGYSSFEYRPFTLEGNFAFAAGLQEMLLQSNAGFIEVFPAIPASWKDVSFNDLRAEGAFLINADKQDGTVQSVVIKSEKGGVMKLKNPFADFTTKSTGILQIMSSDKDFIIVKFTPGASLLLTQTAS